MKLVHTECASTTLDTECTFGEITPRRKWQPNPVLLPGKFHGWRSLVQATVHGVSKSRTRLSNFTFTFIYEEWLGVVWWLGIIMSTLTLLGYSVKQRQSVTHEECIWQVNAESESIYRLGTIVDNGDAKMSRMLSLSSWVSVARGPPLAV